MDKEEIKKELYKVIEEHLICNRDDYMDGIIDGILIAITIIDKA